MASRVWNKYNGSRGGGNCAQASLIDSIVKAGMQANYTHTLLRRSALVPVTMFGIREVFMFVFN